jgi:hypothetical protein
MTLDSRVARRYRRQPLRFSVSLPFSEREDLKIILTMQVAYNENIMFQNPNPTIRFQTVWQGACFLLM